MASTTLTVILVALTLILLRKSDVEKLKRLEEEFRNGIPVQPGSTDLRSRFLALPYLSDKYEIEEDRIQLGKWYYKDTIIIYPLNLIVYKHTLYNRA